MSGLDFSGIMGKAQRSLTVKQPGCLVTVAAPTGSGKTYGVIRYVSKRIVGTTDMRFFFVTVNKANLKIDKFYQKLEEEYIEKNGPFSSEDEKKWYLHRQVAILYPLEETVERLIEVPMPVEVPTQEAQEVVEQLKVYYGRYHSQPKKQSVAGRNDFQNLKNAYQDTKNLLLKALAKELQLDFPLTQREKREIVAYVNEDETSLAHYLNQYFPEINLAQRRLVLLSWAKFIRTYLDFYNNKSIEISSPECLGQAIVILDEIDDMKKQYLDKIIDDAIKVPIDFLSFFREIKTGLNNLQKNRPEDVMRLMRQNQKFAKLKNSANRLAKKYKLTEDYKTVGEKTTTNFIFNLAGMTLTSSRPWWSHQDDLEKRVVLSHQKAPTDLKFYQMIQTVSQFFNHFVHQSVEWAMTYQQQVNKNRSKNADQLSLEDALSTICDCLWLSQGAKQLVIDLYQRLNLGYSKKVQPISIKRSSESGYYLQRQGLQLISLADSDAHLNRTKISAAFVQETPEKFLIRLARRGIVLGMSATVDVPTVISNFDFRFIREQLGDHLIDGLANLPTESQKQFDVSQRCRERGVKINVIEVSKNKVSSENGYMLSLIHKYRPDFNPDEQQIPVMQKLEELVEKKMSLVSSYSQQDKSKSVDYIQKRYFDLFESIIYFLVTPEMTSFLGLQSILPKAKQEIDEIDMSQTFIDQVFHLLSQLFCTAEKHLPQLKMIAKKLSSEHLSIKEQIREALELPEKSQTRVYLLSAYATLGVGQNLQHDIGQLEASRVVDIAPSDADPNDSRRKKVDIAGIYLGRITHVLTQIPDLATDDNKKVWIRAYYEMLSLADSGEISLMEIKKHMINKSLGRPNKQFSQTSSYTGACTRSILQALGRLDRSFNKMPQITVILGDRIRDVFDPVRMKDYQLGPLAQAIMVNQKDAEDEQSVMENVRLERWCNRTLETQQCVASMLGHLQDDARIADHFRQYRRTLLEMPTPTLEQYRVHELDPEFAYLACRESAYHIHRLGETFEFGIEKQGNEEISALSSGLLTILKYPGMRDYFMANGWAIAWVNHGFMMNPVQFDSYKGILGEVAGRFIVERRWHVNLQPLSEENNELFDYQTSGQIYIDFKNWRQPHDQNVQAARNHVQGKLDKVRSPQPLKKRRVLVINLIRPAMRQDLAVRMTEDGRIMEIPQLIDQDGSFALTAEQERMVGVFLNGR
ncbi:hypothetical protein [Levilactobacillus suantsaiihabitans]|uniref:Helicase/UvrB N-terminal domain-containing protein n=1 Tax=Levilactobacillus suantsaiihabitans TaxID=2487722 RepID=A0A4Z0JAY5_9LACO|nr:hypothetical protein [Levilactobacillus suantsaiihabitans]TGD18653.1 hypothetical protein EGT51_07140 [Levilactobacillus suantsaiihabitans]